MIIVIPKFDPLSHILPEEPLLNTFQTESEWLMSVVGPGSLRSGRLSMIKHIVRDCPLAHKTRLSYILLPMFHVMLAYPSS